MSRPLTYDICDQRIDADRGRVFRVWVQEWSRRLGVFHHFWQRPEYRVDVCGDCMDAIGAAVKAARKSKEV